MPTSFTSLVSKISISYRSMIPFTRFLHIVGSPHLWLWSPQIQRAKMYDDILQKGLEDPLILVSARDVRTNPPQVLRVDCRERHP